MIQSSLKTEKGQALLEALVTSFIFSTLIFGFLILGFGLTNKILLRHFLEERLICFNSVNTKANCDKDFQISLQNIPGLTKEKYFKKVGALSAKGHYQWKFLGYETSLSILEESPVDF